MNENYAHPDLPAGAAEGIIRGMYLFREGGRKKKRVQLMGSGTILREVLAAADLLEGDWGVSADVWSLTSCNELGRDGAAVVRWNTLHPLEEPRVPYVFAAAGGAQGTGAVGGHRLCPRLCGAAAALRRAALPRARHRWIRFAATCGRSCAGFFEVDRYYVAVAALTALAEEGSSSAKWSRTPSASTASIRKSRTRQRSEDGRDSSTQSADAGHPG